MVDVRSEVLEALRGYAVAYHESALLLARALGLPTSDGVALGELVYAEIGAAPLSPAALSRRIGLTSGATNALVNRLEARGLVTRSREHDDRRIVTLHPTADAHRLAQDFYGEQGDALQRALGDYDTDQLVAIRDFLVRFTAILPRA
ncbi:MAG: MarR family transcriptional regulator [Nocardioidaceae bacterium]|nr:MarR family transcriptional regulator [Nocardioidaceae bacterium]